MSIKSHIEKIHTTYKKNRLLSHLTEQENFLLKFYSNFISKNDVVFDVGANIGDRSKLFLLLDSVVYAFEPQESCLKKLNKYKCFSDFEVFPYALSHTEGSETMTIATASTVSSFSDQWISSVKKSNRFGHDLSWDKRVKVAVSTLDIFISKYKNPKFIKIDVEGYELEVLKGLTYPVPYISFQFTPEFFDASKKCIEYISKLGDYTFNFTVNDAARFFCEKPVSIKTLLDIFSKEILPYGDKYFGDIYAIHN